MKNLLNYCAISLLSLFSLPSIGSDTSLIDCVFSGDAAQELVRIMNTQNGSDEEKIDQWKQLVAPANLNGQLMKETLDRFLSNRPTKPLPFSFDTVKSCTQTTLKNFNADHAPFCYGIASASKSLLAYMQSGKSPVDVQKQSKETDIPGASRERTQDEISVVVAEFYYFVPRGTAPDAYKVSYFERCLKGEGSAFSSYKRM